MLTLLLALFSVAAAAPCPTSFRVHPNGNAQYCLTVSGTRANPGPATVTQCDGSARQEFKFETDAGSDVPHLRTFDAEPGMGLCLAAEIYRVQQAYNGRQLALTGCYNDGAQGWSQASIGGQIRMLGEVDGRAVCMDLRDGQLDGGAVQIWYCYDDQPNQRWTIEDFSA